MMNVINGGAHAENSIDLQEFMIVPAGAETFSEALRIGAEVFHALKACCTSGASRPRSATRAASRPTSPSSEAALEAILEAAERAGHARPGRDRARPGRHRVLRDGALPASGEGRSSTARDDRLLGPLAERYPIVSLEDGLAEDDWDGWRALTERLGDRVQLVGDDIFVTNVERSSAASTAASPTRS